MVAPVVVAGVVLGGGAASVGGYYGARAVLGPVTKDQESTPYSDDYKLLLQRFARRDGVVDKPAEYQLARTMPAGARQVPILMRARTALGSPQPLPPERYPSNRVAWVRQMMVNQRQALKAAGRGAEDARCAACLSVIESGWGKTAWCWNVANIKGTGAVYGNSDTIASGYVWTKTPEASGCYVLIDRVRSLDCYLAFDSWGDFARYQKRLFTTRYQGVVEGWTLGGLDGLYAGERVLAARGYSGTGTLGRLADARAFWSRMRRLFPADWENREAWNG